MCGLPETEADTIKDLQSESQRIIFEEHASTAPFNDVLPSIWALTHITLHSPSRGQLESINNEAREDDTVHTL
jgi:hypothetical protein